MAQVSGAEPRLGDAGGLALGGWSRLPLLAAIARNLEAEQERWFLWLPVMFGVGIALYFSLPDEPWIWAALLPVPAALALRFGLGRSGMTALATASLLA